MRNLALVIISMGILGLLSPSSSAAQGRIELTTKAEQEVTTTNEAGNEVTNIVPAGKVVPGTVVIYTITAENVSGDPVNSVVINDPIPEHMTYVEGSAEGEGTDIVFSVDAGSTYGVQDSLRVSDGAGGTRSPEAKDYTHIRWTLTTELAPGEARSVSFRSRLD